MTFRFDLMITYTQPSEKECEAIWDDALLRHAYFPENQKQAMCGYSGPSTWKNERTIPVNVCPICIAILPEYWDGAKWIKRMDGREVA